MLIYSIDGNKVFSHCVCEENETHYLIMESSYEIAVPKENYYKTKKEALDAVSRRLLLSDSLIETLNMDSEIDESLLDHRKFKDAM